MGRQHMSPVRNTADILLCLSSFRISRPNSAVARDNTARSGEKQIAAEWTAFTGLTFAFSDTANMAFGGQARLSIAEIPLRTAPARPAAAPITLCMTPRLPNDDLIRAVQFSPWTATLSGANRSMLTLLGEFATHGCGYGFFLRHGELSQYAETLDAYIGIAYPQEVPPRTQIGRSLCAPDSLFRIR